MITSALRGLPVVAILSLGLWTEPCLAQDGPLLLLPGMESSEVSSDPVETPTSEPSVKAPLPVDDSITPLDENGRPMTGPASQETLRLPTPPPLPAAPTLELNPSQTDGPLLGDEPPEQSQGAEPAKKKLWQRSTDALRDLTRPKPDKPSPAEEDAARNWQKLRRQAPPQQQTQQRQMQPQTQQNLTQQRQQLQQRQLQQQQMQQRHWEQRQIQQRQMQQRQLEQRSGQPLGTSAGSPSRYGNDYGNPQAQPQPQSSRRQAQGAVNPSGQQRRAVPSTSRSRQPSQPREAKNDPRSPWEQPR